MPQVPRQHRHELTDDEVRQLRIQVGFTPGDDPAAEERATTRRENRDPGREAREAAEQLRHLRQLRHHRRA